MMKFQLLMLLAVGVGLLGCEGTIELGENTVVPDLPAGGGGKSDASGGPSALLDGAALYQQYCSSCHGADATGGFSFPGSIKGYSPIEPVVVNGLGSMAPVPIPSEEIRAIQTFLMGDTTPGAPPATEGSTPSLEVYARECSSCHGPEGLGTPQGPSIRLRVPDLVRFTVRDGRNGAGNPTSMPRYSREQLPDAQLTEIIDWLDAFPNPATGEGLFNQYCATCHGADGGGGASFRPIAGVIRAQSDIREGHHVNEHANRREYMPAWGPEAISDAEIVLIEQYMRGL